MHSVALVVRSRKTG